MPRISNGLDRYKVGTNSGMRRQYEKFFINMDNVFY
jgi:hypothetical protein